MGEDGSGTSVVCLWWMKMVVVRLWLDEDGSGTSVICLQLDEDGGGTSVAG